MLRCKAVGLFGGRFSTGEAQQITAQAFDTHAVLSRGIKLQVFVEHGQGAASIALVIAAQCNAVSRFFAAGMPRLGAYEA